MRVMVCYYFWDSAISLGEDIAQGFESLGHTVCRFDSTITPRYGRFWKFAKSLAKLVGKKASVAASHERDLSAALSQRFRDAASHFGPELVVVIQGERITASVVLAVCQSHEAKSVLWWVKPPRWQASIFEDLWYYDAVFTIDGSVAGGEIGHLPSWGLNPEVFYPGPFAEKTRKLLFVGSWSPLRQRYLEAVADLPLKIIGGGWQKRLPGNHPLGLRLGVEWIGGRDLADAYRKAWAVIDIPQFEQHEGQGVNMRFADVPACGTVLLTSLSVEVAQWFKVGRDVLTYADPDELRQQCLALLEETESVALLSENAQNAASVLPTFGARANALMVGAGL